jgi:soluble lytic murein transglycosylase-like protein
MPYTRAQLESALNDAAARYGIEPGIAYRQIAQESDFNPNAVSSAGAQGIAQFMPDTAARFGLSNPFDPIASFDAWGRYMRQLLDQFGGRYDLALAGYNSGENRSEYRAAAREGRPINWAVMPPGVQSETRNYVDRILGSTSAPGGDGESNFFWWIAGGIALLAVVLLVDDSK